MSQFPIEERLSAALRLSGVISNRGTTAELVAVMQEIVAEEFASLGGHLLGHYSAEEFEGLTAAGEEVHPLARLGGYLLEFYGREA